MAIVMNISKAKKQHNISKDRPPKTIVGKYMIVSMFLQALLHITSLYIVQKLAGSDNVTYKFNHKFQPTLVNTCVFFMQMFLDCCVTLINYPGKPHMESIFEFKKLLMAIGIYMAGMLGLLFNIAPDINKQLGCVELPDSIRMWLIVIGAANFGLCLIVEKGAQVLFG